jgi:hypothetical protein
LLGRGAEPAELVAAIRTVAHGDALLSPAATRSLVARFLAHPDHRSPPDRGKLVLLTEREREVLILIAPGPAFPPGPAATYGYGRTAPLNVCWYQPENGTFSTGTPLCRASISMPPPT